MPADTGVSEGQKLTVVSLPPASLPAPGGACEPLLCFAFAAVPFKRDSSAKGTLKASSVDSRWDVNVTYENSWSPLQCQGDLQK